MLLNAVAFVALLAIATAAVTGAAMSAARIALLVHAQHAVAPAVTAATATMLAQLAAHIQTTGAIPPSPQFSPLPATCADAACALRVQASIAPVESGTPADAPQLETNAYVSEQRFAARITVSVSANDTVLVTRNHDVVVRETLSPPYAQLAGVQDGDAGMEAASPQPCASLAPGISTDTGVRVEYHNIVSGACSDASAWSDGSYTALSQPQGWRP